MQVLIRSRGLGDVYKRQILNCRFGGPHVYFGEIVYKPFIGDKDRLIHSQDMHKAVDINRRAEILMIIVNIVCLYLVS